MIQATHFLQRNMNESIIKIFVSAVFLVLSFYFLHGYFTTNYRETGIGGLGLLFWMIYVNQSNIFVPKLKRRYSDYDEDEDSSTHDLRSAAQETGNSDWSASSMA